MPSSDGRRGRPFRDHRKIVEGIIYRFRAGVRWRDLPAEFGPYQTVRKRHRTFSGDGTWDTTLARLLTGADAAGEIDWTASVDSTINRAHKHATNLPEPIPSQGDLVSCADNALQKSFEGSEDLFGGLVQMKGFGSWFHSLSHVRMSASSA